MRAEAALRIAIVCPYDLSRPGGVQGQATGLAAALRHRGHEAVVVAPGDRVPGWVSGQRYVAGRAIGVRANGSVAPLSLDPSAAARALGAVRAWGPDVVHIHEPLAPVLGYGILVAHRWPTVATFHRAGAGTGYRVAGFLARWARRRIDVSCAVSEAAKATAAAAWGGTYEVLFNGVDVDRLGAAAPHPSAAPAVLFLGRHERRKGLAVLLDAFERLRHPAVLWITGEGPETDRLRSAHPASERICWLGTVSDEEVAARLAGARVLCAPSLGGESFGMVLVEAMAAGCRVVASDIEGYRAAAAGHALLVRPGDVEALAAALERALAVPCDAPARASAAAHAAHWSMDALAQRYVCLYRRAMTQRGGEPAALS